MATDYNKIINNLNKILRYLRNKWEKWPQNTLDPRYAMFVQDRKLAEQIKLKIKKIKSRKLEDLRYEEIREIFK